MEWNNKGNERKPAMKFGNDIMKEYYYEMEKNNVNWNIETIRVPKIACMQGLANHMIPNYNGPSYRVFDDAEPKVDGEDKPLHCDILVAMYLKDLANKEKEGCEMMDIKVRMSKNVKAILDDKEL